ncbi:MAG: exodeoxyribonuclease VII small subunit [Candidatus Aminicenantes bacterium]|nr:exodeoxyribonuclease VII small subunit [Candidatus Aminicenantes bacterium]
MADLSFEKALAELENIVSKLEEGGLPLNESLSLFEKGVKMAKFLREELEKAEKKTEILLKDESGEVKAEPFVLTSEEKSAEDPQDSGEDEDESLQEEDNDDLPF